MSVSLDTITPLDARLLAESETAAWKNIGRSETVKKLLVTKPADLQAMYQAAEAEVAELRLELSKSQAWADILTQRLKDMTLARDAMMAERDAALRQFEIKAAELAHLRASLRGG